ncbi:MAG: glycosyltransferase family 2 protein [Kofleriaceae bacterium]
MITAVVRASLFDVPYLAVTLPHLLRQTRHAFAERLVIVDPEARRGNGEKGDPAELDRILAEALAAGVIDRVVPLATGEAERRAVHARYFGAASPVALDDDRAIYSTLFGLEAARHDAVAWLDADVLMHASGEGWVAAGLAALAHDDRLWLASTAAGPGRRFARWFGPRHAEVLAAGHFVCDRRRLHGRLRWIDPGRDGASAYVADALERHAASTRIVAGGWHLRTRSHAAPFAPWIAALASALERGDVPASQRDGELHLDHAARRGDWRRVLFPHAAPERPRPIAQLIQRRPVAGTLPISVILPIRDRAGRDVRNALASLAWQRGGRPWETIIVSHGSDPRIDAELRVLATAAGATLIAVGTPADPWCKPLALNTGIRATDPAIPFVMTMDADMILADNLVETVLAELTADPQRIVLCQSSDLPEGCVVPDDVLAQFAELRTLANLRGAYGTGGIQAMRRSFLLEVRGYDEDMLWWGALDTDLVRRAEARGLRAAWITDRTAMLHQWHPRKHRVLDDTSAGKARDSWLRNHELMIERTRDVIRNHGGWGATLGDRRP